MELSEPKRFFGRKYLDEITSGMVEKFKSARKHEARENAEDERTVKNATVNRALTTLKLMFHQAERSGYAVKTILMTMRYVHPAAEQKRVAMEKFEKFRGEAIMSAAAAQQGHGVATKVTTLERVN